MNVACQAASGTKRDASSQRVACVCMCVCACVFPAHSRTLSARIRARSSAARFHRSRSTVVCIVAGGVMRALNVYLVHETFREDSDVGAARRTSFQNTLKCCGWDYSTEEFFPERIACYALNPLYTSTCLGAVNKFIDSYVIPASSVVIVSGAVNLGSLVVALLVIWSFVGGKEDFFDNAFFDN
jgi:hypothetical protein